MLGITPLETYLPLEITQPCPHWYPSFKNIIINSLNRFIIIIFNAFLHKVCSFTLIWHNHIIIAVLPSIKSPPIYEKHSLKINSSGSPLKAVYSPWSDTTESSYLASLHSNYDGFQPKTSPFSTHHLIWLKYKGVSQIFQLIYMVFSYLNSVWHFSVIKLCYE